MSIAKEAFIGLYPDRGPVHEFRIRYSARFNMYNANVHYNSRMMEFRLSRDWKDVGKEIRIGLLQTLMLKAFGDKKKTINIDLYNIFLKKVHVAVPKERVDPVLEESFHRVNEKYLSGMMEMPNLVFGRDSTRKLGSYEYGSDTITISRILTDEQELLDYVMYHELLHKKLKFDMKNSRSRHHTREFREAERMFENYREMESRLSGLSRKSRRWLGFF